MNSRHVVAAISLGLLVLPMARPTTAQQSGAVAGVPVQMVVSVEPKKGNEIPMITRQDIIVNQGHDRRPVTNWVPTTGNRAGLALAILIDDSAGFSLGTQLNDIRAFITEQAPTTLVAIGYMQNGTVSLTQNFTQDHMAAAKSVRLTQGYFGAEASPYLSISEFIKRWPSNLPYPGEKFSRSPPVSIRSTVAPIRTLMWIRPSKKPNVPEFWCIQYIRRVRGILGTATI